MNIEEYKNFAKKKIETENLTNNIRNKIQQVKWQKQDAREGFIETFNPLIKSQESVKKSIDEQQNRTLAQLQANQLAITDGLNQNRLAITDGIKRLKISATPTTGPSTTPSSTTPSSTTPSSTTPSSTTPSITTQLNSLPDEYFDKYLNNLESKTVLKNYNINNLPSYFRDKNLDEIEDLTIKVNSLLFNLNKELKNVADIEKTSKGYDVAEPKSKNPKPKTLKNINDFNIISIYTSRLNLLREVKEQSGKGLFTNKKDIIKRLDLLAASINAGNNGVIPEFSEIAHQLAKMSVITKKQLNELLKNYVLNR